MPNIHFFKHFLQMSHNLRIINGHNMTGENTRKLDTLAKCFEQREVELERDKTIGQLTEVKHHAGFKKLSR